MANIKTVKITGDVPFNLNEHPILASMLAYMNTPTTGIRISYGEQTRMMGPNEHGGHTVMFAFTLSGSEAVSGAWIQLFIKSVKEVGGVIDSALACDSENNEVLPLRI